MRKVKAVLVDPFACEIKPVEYDGDDHTKIYPLLSHESMPVDIFEVVYARWMRPNDRLFVDEEGLLKPCSRFLLLNDYEQPIAGKGLLIGADDEGQSQSAETSLEIVKRNIRFLRRDERGLNPTTEPWIKEDVELATPVFMPPGAGKSRR